MQPCRELGWRPICRGTLDLTMDDERVNVHRLRSLRVESRAFSSCKRRAVDRNMAAKLRSHNQYHQLRVTRRCPQERLRMEVPELGPPNVSNALHSVMLPLSGGLAQLGPQTASPAQTMKLQAPKRSESLFKILKRGWSASDPLCVVRS